MTINSKDSENNVMSQREQALKKWKGYFYNIMKPRMALSPSVCIIENLSDNYDVSLTKYKKSTIIKLKSNKAPGSDNIPHNL